MKYFFLFKSCYNNNESRVGSMAIILLILSILPVFLLARYIYNTDFEKEPKSLLIRLFVLGVGSVVVTLFLTYFLDSLFPFFKEDTAYLDVFELIPYIYIGVALIEEFSKWIFVRVFTYHHYEFNHAYDAIVYAVFVSLGFACLENILYVFQTGLQTAILRGITAVPGHACFGVFMGYYLGMSKTADKHQNKEVSKKNKIKSLVVPVLAHGTYDYFIFAAAKESLFSIAFVIFVIVFFTKAIEKVKQLASVRFDIREQVVSPTIPSGGYLYQYCPMCGEKVLGKYCSKCGHQHFQ